MIGGLLSPHLMGTPQNMQMGVRAAGFTPAPPPQNATAGGPQAQAPGAGMMKSIGDRFLQFTQQNPGALGALGAQMMAGNTAQGMADMNAIVAKSGERNKTLEFLRKNDPDLAAAVEAGMPIGEAFATYYKMKNPPKAEPTSGMQNYQFLLSQGVSPEDAMARAFSGGTTVNVGGDSAPGLGKLSPDYGYVMDPVTRQPVIDETTGLPRAAAVPGSPAWVEQQAANQKAALRQNQATITSDTVIQAARNVREAISSGSLPTTGTAGRLAANLSESSAAEVRRQVDAIRAVAASENINAMRQASPTGGALGNASDADIKLLKDKAGALDPNAGRETFLRQLDDYERTLLRIVHGVEVGDQIFAQTRQQSGGNYRILGVE